MRQWIWRGLLALLLVTAGIVVIVPTSREAVVAVCRGEPLYQGRSASYWGHVLLDRHGPRKQTSGRFRKLWEFLGLDVSPDSPREIPKFDARAAPVFTWLLKHDDPEVRSHAAINLGSYGEGTEEAVQALTEALKDPDRRVRMSAALGLGTTRGRGADVVPALLVALQDEDRAVRSSAVSALGEIGPRPESIRVLIDCLRESDSAIQSAAVRSLKKIGPGAEDAVPALLPFLHHDNYYLKYGSAETLLTIDPRHEAAVETLKLGLMHRKREAQQAAVRGFRAASPTPDVIRALNHATFDDDTFVSWEAELILRGFEHRAAKGAGEGS
jgi:hypothetical protein